MSVHGSRKLVKRKGFLFLFGRASHHFGIVFAIFGFEGLQLDHGLLFAGLLPNPHEFGLNLSSCALFSSVVLSCFSKRLLANSQSCVGWTSYSLAICSSVFSSFKSS